MMKRLSMLILIVTGTFLFSTMVKAEERILIPSVSMRESEEAKNQLSLRADLPEHFSLSAYAIITDLSSGDSYELPLYSANDYEDHLFLPDGTYRVSEIAVYEDSAGLYEFTYPSDFTVEGGTHTQLSTTLTNYEEVESRINERLKADGQDSLYRDKPAEEQKVYTVYQNGAGLEPKEDPFDKVILIGAFLFGILLLLFLSVIHAMKAKIPGEGAYHISVYTPIEKKNETKKTKKGKAA